MTSCSSVFIAAKPAARSPAMAWALSLVAAIAELHGADIVMRDDDAPGLGITLSFPCFTLAFPLMRGTT